MDINLMALFISILALFGAALVIGVLIVVVSALIMHYMSSTRAAKWLDSIWFEPEQITQSVSDYSEIQRGGNFKTVIKK